MACLPTGCHRCHGQVRHSFPALARLTIPRGDFLKTTVFQRAQAPWLRTRKTDDHATNDSGNRSRDPPAGWRRDAATGRSAREHNLGTDRRPARRRSLDLPRCTLWRARPAIPAVSATVALARSGEDGDLWSREPAARRRAESRRGLPVSECLVSRRRRRTPSRHGLHPRRRLFERLRLRSAL